MPEIVEAPGSPASSNSGNRDNEPLIAREPPSPSQASSAPGSSPPSKSWLPGGIRSWIRRVAGKGPSSEPSSPVAAQSTEPSPSVPVLEEGENLTGKADKHAPLNRHGSTASVSGTARRSDPVCLICLETLTSEEFRDGRAMTLDCQCRGDLALRHRECAIKWAQVKGDRICELCKHEVRNLPEVEPRPSSEDPAQHMMDDTFAAHMVDLAPSHADLVFDCVRVTWVAMIVSILFFDMNLASALWTGLVAGLAYSFMVRLMYRQHFSAMQRLAEAHAAPSQQPPGLSVGSARPAQIPVVTVV